jgi:hypothetical protein
MDVMHRRVAGLDVHKETVVACVRVDGRPQANARMPNFHHHDTGSVGIAGVVDGEPGHACRDGSDRRVLDAGVEDPERG